MHAIASLDPETKIIFLSFILSGLLVLPTVVLAVFCIWVGNAFGIRRRVRSIRLRRKIDTQRKHRLLKERQAKKTLSDQQFRQELERIFST